MLKEVADSIEKLYSRFIIRDILAYIFPGALFLFLSWSSIFPGIINYSSLLPHLPLSLSQFLRRVSWIIFLMTSYILGYFLQNVGFLLCILWERCSGIGVSLFGLWDGRSMQDYFALEKRIYQLDVVEERKASILVYREKINSRKLMFGNLTMAFAMALIVTWPWNWYWVILSLVFFVMHCIECYQKRNWEDEMVK